MGLLHDVHQIAEAVSAQQVVLRKLGEDLARVAQSLEKLAGTLVEPVVGIEVVPQHPAAPQ